ncbi:hypothetical protein BDZ91DRAFT_740262 [Kalaharituber pfeilii]|nr:hypothetical protein BDZ91DRAFT_740262 [Kalaharituber pfeilii]
MMAIGIDFPPQILKLFVEFSVICPTTPTALIAALNKVEVFLTTDIMISLLTSMPCRLCFETSTGSSAEGASGSGNGNSNNATIVDIGMESLSFEDLLGKSLGLWKVCLSAQAFKDFQASFSEGNVDFIWAKLVDLSTGDWIRKSLAQPVLRPDLDFRVRLFTARYQRNGRILWQVDRGYDERINADCQIVKVWRIGDVKEIRDTIGIVARAQRDWSDERVRSCKVQSIDRQLRIKVPAILSAVSTADEGKCKGPFAGPDEGSALKSSIISKCYAVTTKVLDNVKANNVDAEFMLDPNGMEMAIIKHSDTATFILGRSGTGKTTCLLYKLLITHLGASLAGESEVGLRQVLLTRSRALAKTLHGKLQRLLKTQMEGNPNLENEHASLYPEPQFASTATKSPWDGGDDETVKTLTSLTQADYPLVCTFDHFLKIVENTIRSVDRQNFRGRAQSDLVDLTIFKAAYWRGISYPKHIKLDAGSVFSEIMGVIKGCALSETGYKPLSRAHYMERSVRLAPAFPSQNEREVLYNIYEQYEVKKRKRHEYDAMDRVTSILRAFDDKNLGLDVRNMVDEIYVDEVQDQRPAEIKLFLNLVQDPRGIHFAGDSAQSISNDSAFRFPNVKALFSEHYKRAPTSFTLSHNFRSHQGILGLASFIMSLLWKGFPAMVDKLTPEVGEYKGPKPRFLVGSCVDELLTLSSEYNSSEGRLDQQIIIVRDAEMKAKLPRLKRNAVVYTVLESKGMEEKDVLLYDFFSSSPCGSMFRSLQQLLPENINYYYAMDHMAMCSELKTLYVAVTRACSRLWILESSKSHVTNIIDLFTKQVKKPLIEVMSVETSNDIRHFAEELRPVTHTEKPEWVRTGDQCMEHALFEQAVQCFENGGDRVKTNLAQAYLAEQTGRELRATGNLAGSYSHYREAKDLFESVGMLEKVAGCYEALENFVAAADIWSSKGRHERAGDLLVRAGRLYWERAAEEYYKADLHAVALQVSYDGGLYEKVVKDLRRYEGKVSLSERKLRVWQCNDLLRKQKITTALSDEINNLFQSEDEKIQFLFGYRYFDEYLVNLTRLGRFEEGWHSLVFDADGIFHALSTIRLHTNPIWYDANFAYFEEIYRSQKVQILLDSMAPSGGHNESPTEGPWSKSWRMDFSKFEQRLLATMFELPHVAVLRADAHSNTQPLVDLLCMLVTLRTGYFLNPIVTQKQLSAIPILLEYILELSSGMYIRKTNAPPTFPNMIQACLGLLNIPWSARRYLRLHWSSVAAPNATPGITKEYSEQILMDARVSLRANICEAVGSIIKATRALLCEVPGWTEAERTAMDTAWGFPLDTVEIRRKLPNDKKYVREKLQYLSRIYSMQAAIERNCTGAGCDHSKFMTRNMRDDIVLGYLKFHSSFEGHPEVLSYIVHELNVRCKPILESLRTTAKDTLSISIIYSSDFTVALKNYRLMTMFNDATHMQSTMDKLHRKFHEHLDSSCLLETKIFNCLYSYNLLRYMTHEYTVMYTAKRDLLGKAINDMAMALVDCVSLLNDNGKLSFPGMDVISMFEDVATLLLVCRRRRQTLFPESWRVRYLSPWVNAIVSTNATFPYPSLESALCKLGSSFCVLLKVKPAQTYQQSERYKLLERRCIDFLVVLLLNCGDSRAGPRTLSYTEFFQDVQEVFKNDTLLSTKLIQQQREGELLNALLHAFKLYTGNDRICVFEPVATLQGEEPHLDLTHLPHALKEAIEFRQWPHGE